MSRALAFCCVFVLAVPCLAAAEWHLAPMVGLTFKGSTTLNNPEFGADDVHRQFGGAVALLSGGVFGVEGVFVYTPGFFDHDDELLVKSSRSYALMGNVVATLPRRWTEYSLRPFVSGGLGVIALRTEEDILPFDVHLPGFNIGGGAIGFLSKRAGLRFDVRYYRSLYDTNQGAISFPYGHARVRYMTASVGVVIRK